MLIYDQIYIILFVFYMLVSTEIKLLFLKTFFSLSKRVGGGLSETLYDKPSILFQSLRKKMCNLLPVFVCLEKLILFKTYLEIKTSFLLTHQC